MSRQINVISREEWGGRKPKEELQPFPFPAKTVVMTLKTDFGECNTKEECIKKCQEIQNQHMDEWGLPDIAYNFLFGNDGNVYEARGWDFKPQRAIDNPEHGPQTYNIALIGDYRRAIPDGPYNLAVNMLQYGVQYALLTEDHMFVGCDYDVNPKSSEPQPIAGDDTKPEIFIIDQ